MDRICVNGHVIDKGKELCARCNRKPLLDEEARVEVASKLQTNTKNTFMDEEVKQPEEGEGVSLDLPEQELDNSEPSSEEQLEE